jgi:PhzF family phenazine biosynthesis protein
MTLRYQHVDVFAPSAYRGNSLAVFTESAGLTGGQMSRITQELRHFESVFLTPGEHPRDHHVRVFDLLGELEFAGHPIIGAAAALHALLGTPDDERWTMRLADRTVEVATSVRHRSGYAAVLDQGAPAFLDTPEPRRLAELAAWFSLDESDLDPAYPPEVISTGLRYLVLPVHGPALAMARIALPHLEAKLAGLAAQFAYLLDVTAREARHWNNDGVVEDVATGSGAGCAAAYMRRHDVIGDGETAVLRQGRFTGRPSEMTIRANGAGTDIRSVEVGGDVVMVGGGHLDVLPEDL